MLERHERTAKANELLLPPGVEPPPLVQSIVAVPPHQVGKAPGGREVDMEYVLKVLVPDLEVNGQLLPGVIYQNTHQDITWPWLCPEGNHRLAACHYLRVNFQAALLEREPTPSELRRIRVAIATKHNAISRSDLGAELLAEKLETGATQQQLGLAFHLDQSMVSKLLAPYENGVEELIVALRMGWIGLTSAPYVAALTPEQQREVLQELAALCQKDRLPETGPRQVRPVKRAAVEAICGRYQLANKKAKPKPTKAAGPGWSLSLADPSPEFLLRLAEAMKAVAKGGGLEALVNEMARKKVVVPAPDNKGSERRGPGNNLG